MPLVSGRHFGGGPKQRLTSSSAFQGHKLDICQLPDRWPSKPTAHLDNRSATQRRAERFVGKRQRLIGRKSLAFWPNITVSRIENWLTSNVALCAIWEIPYESPHRPILRQSANPRRHPDGTQPQCFPPCGVHASHIAAGNASIPLPPGWPADLIGQSGLAHKADRPNKSPRANVREPHAEL